MNNRTYLIIPVIILLTTCKKEKEDIPVSLTKKVIVDTDADADDAMAISYLLQSKGIEVIAITVTGTGFMLQEQGVPVILKLLAMNGKPTIPVSYGASTDVSCKTYN
ncbi:MAG: nucleoside hydrolase [Bacteroidetes bacterium]|nr:nucleoside hydrolase [Bacteroidota bacterium]MBL6944318.1 nucleoside hydrolase [Bacteroidales bacterium]